MADMWQMLLDAVKFEEEERSRSLITRSNRSRSGAVNYRAKTQKPDSSNLLLLADTAEDHETSDFNFRTKNLDRERIYSALSIASELWRLAKKRRAKRKRTTRVWVWRDLVSKEMTQEEAQVTAIPAELEERDWESEEAEEEATLTAMPSDLLLRLFRGGGRGFVKVVEKRLTKTDVTRNNNRLSMPEKRLSALPEEFLNVEELERIVDNEDVTVVTVDEQEREYDKMKLKLWNMKGSKVYNLITDWTKLVRNNGLAPDNLVQVWAFSCNGEPRFAVLKVNPAGEV